MTTLHDMEHCWDYAIRQGFVTKPGFPGWLLAAERDMVTIEHLINHMGGDYPFECITQPFESNGFRYPWLSTIMINGQYGKLACDLHTWHSPTPDNCEQATIVYATITTPEDLVIKDQDLREFLGQKLRNPFKPVLKQKRDQDEHYWPREATAFLKRYCDRFGQLNPEWHVNHDQHSGRIWIESPDFTWPTLLVEISYNTWERPSDG